MKKKTLCLLISVLGTLCSLLYANEFNFSQIGSRNGLSQNTVRAIAVDKNGFIWAGTLDGLNRYDGYNIRSYQPQISNPNSLADHRIRDLFVDRDGFLWVKTYKDEFSCYNPLTDSFIQLSDAKGAPLTYSSFHESARGEIWFWGKSDGVMRLSKRKGGVPLQEQLLSKGKREGGCVFLFEDSKGTVWIGGEWGLKMIAAGRKPVRYGGDYKKYTFTQAVEMDGKIYFSTKESVLLVYDLKKHAFKEVLCMQRCVFLNLAAFSDKRLLLVTKNHGVLIYETDRGVFAYTQLDKDADLTGDLRLVVDEKKGVWLYNHSGMVWYYNQYRAQWKKMRLIPEEIARVVDLERYMILADSTGLVWITTYGNGLFCYDERTDELKNYRNTPDASSLPSDYLLSLTEDQYGNIWVGCEYAGIIRIVKTPDYIRYVRPEANSIIGKNNNVRAICESSRKEIWVGTKNGSLYVYDTALTRARCIGEGLNPYTLVEDAQQRMWVGTKGNGVYVYDVKTGKELAHLRHQEKEATSLSNDVVFHILKDKENRLWIGSFGGGLNLVEEEGQRIHFRRFIQMQGDKSLIRYLHQDRKGMIWAGSSDGLICFDPEQLMKDTDAYVCYRRITNQPQSLSSNDIKTIYEDHEGTLWIGTAGGGLNKVVRQGGTGRVSFKSFTVADGMVDNYVLGILEHGNDLWISSENGLSRFNKKEETVVSYMFAQKSYGNIFNEGAYYQCANGTMLWGSLDGLLVFNPDKFVPDKQVPPVLITRLLIDGVDWNDMKPGADKPSITYTDRVKLTHKQNTLSIDFATLSLRKPGNNMYTYILENYDRKWSAPTHENSVAYKNLLPGTYVFRVKGTNADGVWNVTESSLEIVIAPPFWKSGLAYWVYFICAGGLLYLALRLVMKFNRLNNAVEVEKQLTNHKLRFFTNISHEFRTPLTLIRGAVENLNGYSVPAAMAKQLRILNRNSLNLTQLIDQLLEFRKLQNDVCQLDLEEIDVVEFARDIYTGFQEVAEQKKMNYLFTTEVDSLRLFLDRKKVDKILYNLLSNAFKFTSRGGRIELLLRRNEKEEACVISVKDNGVGIPKEKQNLLFSRFTQINFSSSGTGIGLSLVKEFVEVHKGKVMYEDNPGGGSVFTVEFSMRKDVYQGENFLESLAIANLAIERVETSECADVKDAPTLLAPVDSNQELDEKVPAGYRLLIIDDNDDIREFLQDAFGRYMQVDMAEDGEVGLRMAIENNPDLIICDVMMPVMDGFEVTRRLKNEFHTCHIPIVLLTAHSSVEHQLEGIESGADAYITKPFSLKYLVKRVTKLIEQREQLKRRFSKELVIDGNLVTITDRDQAFMERIKEILEENYRDEHFTIDKFVELSSMKRTLFFKKIKGITGFSPNELIKLKRLNESAVLLREGNWTVSEVSYRVGFEDPYYFSKCFKAQFNCTPSKFKQGE
ncbi:hybrid sensor histidine kinase/response regulator transcription factor [Bacteroides ihuae]|uniref:hybrid sensor histidine kinase/response regulator transcription factor n=1 Tax=Bacteroides ihuae TaxID=1852362 RepID=UPI0008DA5DBA|nr:hybrid sensor histidine kinase/response regulator transcription factor [Bacteroides ihuae]